MSPAPSPVVTREGLAETGIDAWHLFLREGDRLVYPPLAFVPPAAQPPPAPGRKR